MYTREIKIFRLLLLFIAISLSPNKYVYACFLTIDGICIDKNVYETSRKETIYNLLRNKILISEVQPYVRWRSAVSGEEGKIFGNNFASYQSNSDFINGEPYSVFWPNDFIDTFDEIIGTSDEYITSGFSEDYAWLGSTQKRSLYKYDLNSEEFIRLFVNRVNNREENQIIISPQDGKRSTNDPNADLSKSRWVRFSEYYENFYLQLDKGINKEKILFFYFYQDYSYPIKIKEKFSDRAVCVLATFNAFPATNINSNFDHSVSLGKAISQIEKKCQKIGIFDYIWKLNWLGLWWPRDIYTRHTLELIHQNPYFYISQNNIWKSSIRELKSYFIISYMLINGPDSYSQANEEFFYIVFKEDSSIAKKIFDMMDDDFFNSPNIPGKAILNYNSTFNKETILNALSLLDSNSSKNPAITWLELELLYNLQFLEKKECHSGLPIDVIKRYCEEK